MPMSWRPSVTGVSGSGPLSGVPFGYDVLRKGPDIADSRQAPFLHLPLLHFLQQRRQRIQLRHRDKQIFHAGAVILQGAHPGVQHFPLAPIVFSRF